MNQLAITTSSTPCSYETRQWSKGGGYWLQKYERGLLVSSTHWNKLSEIPARLRKKFARLGSMKPPAK